MSEPAKEVTALNSTALLTREIADLRETLRNLIVVGKNVAPMLPAKQRAEFVDVIFKAELKIK